MVVAGLVATCWLAFSAPTDTPRVVAHAQLHSYSAFESMIDEVYAAQGFGGVFRVSDRFAALRALVGADVGDRPCVIALVAGVDGAADLVGIAPDALRDHALQHPRAFGGDPALHAFVEDAASARGWLSAAADDDATLRVFVDVAALREVWGDEIGSFAAMVRSWAALRAMLMQSSPAVEHAVDLLDRSLCTLDAWSSVECSLSVRLGRLSARANLVPEAGSAADHALRTWQPLPIPARRIAFDGADLQGFVGPSDVDAHALLCGSLPETLSDAHADVERFARLGGVFAFGVESHGVGLLLPYGEHPLGDPAWPAAWRVTATRCMSPLAGGDEIGSDALYVRMRPAPWLQSLYDRADPRLRVPDRAADGWVEVHGRPRAGALQLEIDVDGAALAAVIPSLRIP
ncbi:MAG: hypothetical protein IPH13_14900 [Planctomycetes bacterium]|nr:hypothetical protein [Planctomycetota bacterium]MCC7170979.1 hypothetical protein [Planctomycetota bacterium]